MIAIPLVVCALLFAMTFGNRPRRAALGGDTDERARLRGDLVNDIRTANQYCGVFVALLGVLATIAVTTVFTVYGIWRALGAVVVS
jgi:hypothetical protein